MSKKAWGSIRLDVRVLNEVDRIQKELIREQKENDKRRREAERQLKLDLRKTEMLERLNKHQNSKNQLVGEDLLQFVTTSEIEIRTNELHAAINGSRTRRELTEVSKEISILLKDWVELLNEARRIREERNAALEGMENDRRSALIRIRNIGSEIAEFKQHPAADAIYDELLSIENRAQEIKRRMNGGNQAGAVDTSLKLESELRALISLANGKWANRLNEKEKLLELVAELEVDLNVLKQNPIVNGWKGKEITEVEQYVNAIREDVNSDTTTSEDKMYDVKLLEYKKYIELLENQAQEIQLQEEQRSYVIKGVANVLRDMGFVISNGPNLLNPEEPSSTVVMKAALPTGKNVDVKVNLNGNIYTDFDGYSDESCSNDLNNFKSSLEKTFAISYEIRGQESHNPDKIKKGAKGVPGGAMHQTHQ